MRKLHVDGSVCLLLAVCILLVPLNWLLAALAAACFHELCHWVAIYLTGGRIHSIDIFSDGMVIETGPMSRGQELACALAGPAGSIFLLLFARWFPRIALCAAVQGVFNLLPIFPLDGGRVLRCVLLILFPSQLGERVMKIQESCVIVIVLILGIVLSIVWKLGVLPAAIAFFLTIRAIMRKIPCKPGQVGVQ